MHTIRRVGGLAVIACLLGSFVGGPAASAQTTTETKTPETYLGSATGAALVLNIGSNGVSAGNATAKIDSTLKALAEGVGTLNTGILPLGGTLPVTASVTAEGKVNKDLTCAVPGLPAPLNSLLTVGVACGSALAEVQNGLPRAVAVGKVMALDLKVNNALDLVLGNDALAPVLALLNPILGDPNLDDLALLDAVNQLLTGLTGGVVPPLNLGATLGDLLNALTQQTTLSIKIGDATSEVSTSGGTVTSTASAQGGVISLLPINLPLPTGGFQVKPLIEIVIGSSKATATYNRTGGTASGTFDPAIATVRLNLPIVGDLGQLLGIDLKEIKIAPNLPLPALGGLAGPCPDASNELCILTGTPLESRIALASGRTVNNPDGTVGAVADAVKIHLLKNIGQLVQPLSGGLLLQLGHTEAGVGGKPADLTTVVLPLPELPRELPRTGGTPLLPLVGLAGLATALVTRRVVRSR